MKYLALFVIFGSLILVQSQTVYNMKVEFDSTTIGKIIQAQQVVVIASNGVGNGWYSVWASFSPFVNNYLTWNTSSGGLSVYVSITPLSPGNSLFVGYSVYATPSLLYPCLDSIFASGRSSSWVSKTQIGIINNSTKSQYTFGLLQSINVNGKWVNGPISLMTILEEEHALFPVTNDLFIFLAPNTITTGLITDNLMKISNSPITSIDLSGNPNNIVATYYPINGKFSCTQCS